MTKRYFHTLFWCIVVFTSHLSAFNHPEIKWRSVITEHFIIHYYDRTEPAVYAVWKQAEEVYESLSPLYDFNTLGKINIGLADYDDYSNGSANWTNESVMIWITDMNFDFRGNTTWLRNVVTHELAHIITLQKKSGMQLLDWTLRLEYSSPNTDIALTEPYAMSAFWPNWFEEGIAQRESQRAGNDGWDSRRDMLLRDAVLFAKPLSLAEMGYFNHNGLGNELVYNQGFSFVTFIEGRIGYPKLRELYDDGRRMALFARHFDSYFQEHTGLSLKSLYTAWIDSVTDASRRKPPPTLTPVKSLWSRGFLNQMPKLSRDRRLIGWLTNDRDDFSRTDLIIAPYAAAGKNLRIPWAKQSWDFSSDGKKVYYIKSRTPDGHGSYFNDIFMRDLEDNRDRAVVRNARAYDIAVAPGDSVMAWIRFERGVFSIVKSDPGGGGFAVVIEGTLGEPFRHLSFNPGDPRQIVTTRIIDGKARLFVVDMQQKTLTRLTDANAQEEAPFWSEDGRIYYSADYDGINTIYSVDADGSDCLRHATTDGGLFYPCVADDSTIICSRYHGRQLTIVSCTMMKDSSYEAPDGAEVSLKPLQRPKGKVTIQSLPYEPTMLRPIWELQTSALVDDTYGKIGDLGIPAASNHFADSMDFSLVAGIVQNCTDALNKRSSGMGLFFALQKEGALRDTAGDTVPRPIDAAVSRPFRKSLSDGFFRGEPLKRRPARPARPAVHFDNQRVVSAVRAFQRYRDDGRGAGFASTGSGARSTALPMLVPSIGWLSNEHTPSLRLNIQGIFLSNLMPSIIAADGEAQWQILRDLFAAFSPRVQFYTMTFFADQFIHATSLPVSITLNTDNYGNTDISYNASGITRIWAAVVPSFFPVVASVSGNNGADADSVSIISASSTTGTVGCMHGFGISRYSSLLCGAEASITRYSRCIGDPLDTLRGCADQYSTGDLSVEYIFPLARQINKGHPYADALYGTVMYEGTFHTSRMMTDNVFLQALSCPSADPRGCFVSHSIGVGLKFGFMKSNAFFRICSLRALWDIWGKRLAVIVRTDM